MGKVSKFLSDFATAVVRDNDKGSPKKPKKLKRMFFRALAELPDNKLKSKLLENKDTHFDKFFRQVEQYRTEAGPCETTSSTVDDVDTEPEDTVTDTTVNIKQYDLPKGPFIYNFYHNKTLALDEKALSKFEPAEQQNISRNYVKQALSHTDQDVQDRLTQAFSKLSPDYKEGKPLKELKDLLMCVCGSRDPATFQKALSVFFSVFNSAAEDTISRHGNKRKKLEKFCSSSKEFLLFIHLNYSFLGQKMTSYPTYEDLMAGVLASYVDVCLALFHCTDADEDAPCSEKSMARHLCSVVFTLLRERPHCSTDVILQLENVRPSDQNTLLPLSRNVLYKASSTVSEPADYTKYILSARQVTHWWPDDTTDLRQAAECVSAPSGYLDWLRSRAPALLEEFPENKRFRGAAISRFIMSEDLTDETFQGLLDILSANVEMPTVNGAEQTDEEGDESQDSQQPQGMFVLDVNPDRNISNMLTTMSQKFDACLADDTMGDGDDFKLNFDSDLEDQDIIFEVYNSKEEAACSGDRHDKVVLQAEIPAPQSDSGLQWPVMFGSHEVDIIIQSDDDKDLEMSQEFNQDTSLAAECCMEEDEDEIGRLLLDTSLTQDPSTIGDASKQRDEVSKEKESSSPRRKSMNTNSQNLQKTEEECSIFMLDPTPSSQSARKDTPSKERTYGRLSRKSSLSISPKNSSSRKMDSSKKSADTRKSQDDCSDREALVILSDDTSQETRVHPSNGADSKHPTDPEEPVSKPKKKKVPTATLR